MYYQSLIVRHYPQRLSEEGGVEENICQFSRMLGSRRPLDGVVW